MEVSGGITKMNALHRDSVYHCLSVMPSLLHNSAIKHSLMHLFFVNKATCPTSKF